MSELHMPPHSIEAEQSLLGSILLNNDVFDTVSETVSVLDFYTASHRTIWSAAVELIEVGKPADYVTVTARLDASGAIDCAGGREYVAGLAFAAPTALNARRYAEIVRERSILRQLLVAASQMQTLVSNPLGQSASELLEQAQALLAKLEEKQESNEQQKIGAYTSQFLDTLEKRMERGGIQGLATGLDDLDALTCGLQAGDFIVVAGRPSMGKSALAMQIAQHAAINDKRVAVFSLEMGRLQLLERMVSNIGRVDGDIMRSGRMQNEHWDGISGAVGCIANLNLWLDDAAGLSVARLRSKVRKIARKGGLDLIVVDYIGLMDGPGENRYAQVSEISRKLKLLAREMNVPLVGLAQLNRQTQGRPDKRPVMSDLRDSGALEQDADVIILMHREDYYDEASPLAGVAEARVVKQRMGRTDTVYLTFRGEYSRFDSLPRGWRPPRPEAKTRSRGVD